MRSCSFLFFYNRSEPDFQSGSGQKPPALTGFATLHWQQVPELAVLVTTPTPTVPVGLLLHLLVLLGLPPLQVSQPFHLLPTGALLGARGLGAGRVASPAVVVPVAAAVTSPPITGSTARASRAFGALLWGAFLFGAAARTALSSHGF